MSCLWHTPFFSWFQAIIEQICKSFGKVIFEPFGTKVQLMKNIHKEAIDIFPRTVLPCCLLNHFLSLCFCHCVAGLPCEIWSNFVLQIRCKIGAKCMCQWLLKMVTCHRKKLFRKTFYENVSGNSYISLLILRQ